MKITLNNNQSNLDSNIRDLLAIDSHGLFTIRVPGAFYSPAFASRKWDGKVHFMNSQGNFPTGKLMQMLQIFEDRDIEIIDNRPERIIAGPIPQSLNGYKLREYQFNAVKAIKYNKVYGISYPRGILAMATNAGKTIISAAIYQTYQQPTAFYVKSKELYNQAIKDLGQFIPGKVGYISSTDGESWNDFMVIMVPTVAKNIRKWGPKLAKFKVVLVDECDESTSKTFKKALQYTYNAYVKIGLSGSVFTDKRATKRIKNETVRGNFGEILFNIRNTELMDKDHSSKVKVRIWKGYRGKGVPGGYQDEYAIGIINCKERNQKIYEICKGAYMADKLPALVIVKNHEHIESLLEFFAKVRSRVDWVHHERKDRDDVVDRFAKGEIEVLIGSYILKRGKNFPLMRTLVNAGAGDSMENVLQILGRATRKSDTKEYTEIHDFNDEGEYLRRHSRHRLIVYKNEGLPITIHE